MWPVGQRFHSLGRRTQDSEFRVKDSGCASVFQGGNGAVGVKGQVSRVEAMAVR